MPNGKGNNRHKRAGNGSLRSGGASKSGLVPLPDYPPVVSSTRIVRRTLPFETTAAFNGAITVNDLLDLRCVGTTAATAYRVWDSIRLRKIRIWSTVAVLGTPTKIVFTPVGNTLGASGIGSSYESASMGTARPCKVGYKWDPASQLGQWMSTSSTAQVFTLNVPIGTIIILDVDTTDAADNASATIVTGAIACTLGRNYIRYLDSTSTKVLQPYGTSFA